jgi:hypothetical protein
MKQPNIQSVQSSQKNEYNTSKQHRVDQLIGISQFSASAKYKVVIYGHKAGGPKIARKGSGPFSRVGVSMMRIA